MSDSTNNNSDQKSGKKALVTLLKWAVIADVVWAFLIATFQAVVLAEAGGALGTSTVGTTLGVVLGWIISFIIGLFQGAIFMFVGGVFIFVILVFISVLKNQAKDKKSGDGSGEKSGD